MELLKCREDQSQVSEEENTHQCRTPSSGTYTVVTDRKFRDKIAGTIVVAVAIAVGFGFIHVIRGTNLDFPFHLAVKNSFGYSETFINIDKITGMPWIAAKSKYPIGCQVLQEKGYIETDEQFEGRVEREFEEEMKQAQAEFMEEYQKLLEQQ